MFDFTKLIEAGEATLKVVEAKVTELLNDQELIEAVESQLDAVEEFVLDSIEKALDYVDSYVDTLEEKFGDSYQRAPDFMAQFRGS